MGSTAFGFGLLRRQMFLDSFPQLLRQQRLAHLAVLLERLTLKLLIFLVKTVLLEPLN